MSKRCSRFARHKNDLYLTPPEAVAPLRAHLAPALRFIEPCAADGGLARMLEGFGHTCVGAYDIVPQAPHVEMADALTIDAATLGAQADLWITNPAWTREVLHALIDALAWQMPAWLLFDADWCHTRQAGRFLPHCARIVSVGRVRWISGSPHTGKDNAAWHLFAPRTGPPAFYGRDQAAAPAFAPFPFPRSKQTAREIAR